MPGLIADLIELGGAGLSVTTLPDPTATAISGVIRLGVHRSGPIPSTNLEAFDVLFSADPLAPRPWVGVSPDRLDAEIGRLQAAVTFQPAACAAAAQVLRMTPGLPFDQALALESLA